MAARRLTLDRTGMKSPLDVGAVAAETTHDVTPVAVIAAPEPAQAPAEPPVAEEASAPAEALRTPENRSEEVERADDARSTGQVGASPYARQTSIVFDIELAEQATVLAASAGVSLTALLIALLSAHLPDDVTQAGETALLERLDHPDAVRIARNIRVPQPLRARLDELASPHERVVPGARSLLINAVLRAHLPDTPERAGDLVRAHARRQAFEKLRASGDARSAALAPDVT